MARKANARELSGTFTGTGRSDHLMCKGPMLAFLNFGTGTVTIDVSRDETNWFTIRLPDGSTAASYTADAVVPLQFDVPVWVSFNCSAFTASITYELVSTSVDRDV